MFIGRICAWVARLSFYSFVNPNSVALRLIEAEYYFWYYFSIYFSVRCNILIFRVFGDLIFIVRWLFTISNVYTVLPRAFRLFAKLKTNGPQRVQLNSFRLISQVIVINFITIWERNPNVTYISYAIAAFDLPVFISHMTRVIRHVLPTVLRNSIATKILRGIFIGVPGTVIIGGYISIVSEAVGIDPVIYTYMKYRMIHESLVALWYRVKVMRMSQRIKGIWHREMAVDTAKYIGVYI